MEANNIIILGAGASADYGIPLWEELKDLIPKELKNDNSKVAGIVKEIIEKASKDNLTIDKALFDKLETIEEAAYNNCHNLFFSTLEKIFNNKRKMNTNGWLISFLEKNINLNNHYNFFKENIIINFNYDNILCAKLYNFFSQPRDTKIREEARANNKSIENIKEKYSEIKDYYAYIDQYPTKYNIFHPHGRFSNYETDDYNNGKPISCYDATGIFKEVNSKLFTLFGNKPLNLIVLGVSPTSLEYNLKKLELDFFKYRSKMHFTCFKEGELNTYLDYFKERFKLEDKNLIKYKDCLEFAEKFEN